jgi:hypothetical protein
MDTPMDADGEAVLQFLLGKTSAMPLEDTRSVTSTGSSQASDATSAAGSGGCKDEDEEEDALEGREADKKIVEVDGGDHPLKLLPICEDEREVEQQQLQQQQQQQEEEEEEDMGTDHESTDDEREGGEEDETQAEGDEHEEESDAGQWSVLPEMIAGTESEAEDEDGCGSAGEQDAAPTEDCPAAHEPLLRDGEVSKNSDTRAVSPPNCAEEEHDGTTHIAPSEAAASTPGKPSEEPSRGELALVSVVSAALLAYVIACIYSFLYRDIFSAIVLPDTAQFEHPVDMTNASVRIISPLNHSVVSAPLLRLDWQLENLPADALKEGGPEVFKYVVFVNDKLVKSEIALLELTPSEEEDKLTRELNRSMTQYIRWEALDTSAEAFTVRIDVQMTAPGTLDQFTTFSQSLVVVNGQKTLETSSEDDLNVLIKTPAEDERLSPDDDLVLTYTVGVGVEKLRVEVDGALVAWKTHVDDGVLLLHGLADGDHEITLTAMGQSDSDVSSSSSSVHIHVGAL